jgi:hypothetical protein
VRNSSYFGRGLGTGFHFDRVGHLREVGPTFKRTRRTSTILVRFIVVVCMFSPWCSFPASSERLDFGVNRLNQGWMTTEDWERSLIDMRSVGIRDLRLTLTDPIENSINSIIRAYQLGFRILLSVNLNLPEYFKASAVPREPYLQFNRPYRLSDLDLDRLMNTWKKVQESLERNNVWLDGIEIGNEINWADFNGDLPVGRDYWGHRHRDCRLCESIKPHPTKRTCSPPIGLICPAYHYNSGWVISKG